MAIVTISRELGSGGDTLAEMVANELGYTLVDHRRFHAETEKYGLLRPELEKVDERKPGLLDRFFRERQAVYLDLLQAIVYDFAEKDNAVIVGRGANFLLKDIGHAFHVRVVSSFEARKKRLMENEGVTGQLAEEFIAHNDQERSAFTKYFFNARWGDPSLYDMVINTTNLDLETACKLILQALSAPRFVSPEPRSGKILQSLSLTKRLKAELMSDERIDASGVTIIAEEEGRLLLKGRVNSPEEKELAVELLSKHPEVREVRDELVVMPPIEGWYPV